LPSLGNHGPHREVIGTRACLGTVTVDEQKLTDPVGRRRQEVPAEPQDVAISCVDAGDRPPSHQLYLMGDGDTRHRGPTNMVVGNQKRVGNATHDADLVSDVHHIRSGRRLDLANDPELGWRHGPPYVCRSCGCP
jgi:hypothetical protein